MFMGGAVADSQAIDSDHKCTCVVSVRGRSQYKEEGCTFQLTDFDFSSSYLVPQHALPGPGRQQGPEKSEAQKEPSYLKPWEPLG
jgi:hypothetical protein